MYGTLTDPTPAGDAPVAPDAAGRVVVIDAGQFEPEQRHQGKPNRKHILSHCHVQESANGGAAGGPPSSDESARRRLIAASVVCLLFMIGEVIGGVLSNSLAIATDAAHLLTDFASFMISLFALWLSSRPASKRMSFGWYRAEVVGALLSVLMIWLVTGLLVYMAVERLVSKEFEIDSVVMLATATAGLAVNIVMAFTLHGTHHHHHHGHSHDDHNHDHSNHSHLSHINETQNSNNARFPMNASEKASLTLNSSDATLNSSHTSMNNHPHHHDHDHHHHHHQKVKTNINVRAAFVHVVGDFIQSLGVLVAALVIHFHPEWQIMDPICTFIFSFIVLLTTITILRDAINVLMEGMPDGINLIEVRDKLQQLPGVLKVHNLRIWSLSLDKIAISTHLVIDNSQTASETLKLALETLRRSYNFFESTIQIEEYADEMRDCEQCQDEEEGTVVNLDHQLAN